MDSVSIFFGVMILLLLFMAFYVMFENKKRGSAFSAGLLIIVAVATLLATAYQALQTPPIPHPLIKHILHIDTEKVTSK